MEEGNAEGSLKSFDKGNDRPEALVGRGEAGRESLCLQIRLCSSVLMWLLVLM